MNLVKSYTSSHWYKKDGTPCFEVPSADGTKMVKTTITHARKLGLVPSVTTINGLLAKPELNNWIQEQLLLSSLTSERGLNETEQEYIKRIIDDSREHSINAMGYGTAVHAFCEMTLSKQVPDDTSFLDLISTETKEAIVKFFGQFDKVIETEKSLANDKYAGTMDAIVEMGGDLYLIDFKTQNTKKGEFVYYDEWLYQLMAYKRLATEKLGLTNLNLANICISSNELGLIELHIYTEEECIRAGKIFDNLLELFYLIKKLEA
jgi:hypothetical protein